MKSMLCEVVAENRNGQQTAWFIRAKVGAKRQRIGQWATPGFQENLPGLNPYPNPYPIHTPFWHRGGPEEHQAIQGPRAQAGEAKARAVRTLDFNKEQLSEKWEDAGCSERAACAAAGGVLKSSSWYLHLFVQHYQFKRPHIRVHVCDTCLEFDRKGEQTVKSSIRTARSQIALSSLLGRGRSYRVEGPKLMDGGRGPGFAHPCGARPARRDRRRDDPPGWTQN